MLLFLLSIHSLRTSAWHAKRAYCQAVVSPYLPHTGAATSPLLSKPTHVLPSPPPAPKNAPVVVHPEAVPDCILDAHVLLLGRRHTVLSDHNGAWVVPANTQHTEQLLCEAVAHQPASSIWHSRHRITCSG